MIAYKSILFGSHCIAERSEAILSAPTKGNPEIEQLVAGTDADHKRLQIFI